MQTQLEGDLARTDVPPREQQTETRDARYLFAGIAVACIWVATAVASIWSPDMITGSEHERLPIAAFGDWFYAALATGLVLMAFSRRTGGATRALWAGFAIAIAGVWGVVAIASVFAPTMVTGSDPTTIPVGAFAAPVAGIIATAFVSVFVAGSPGQESA